MQKYLIILCIFLCGNKWVSAQGSNIAQTEKELIEIHGKLTASKYGDFDSLEYFSNLFSTRFTDLISANPKTLKFSFRRLIDAHICNIETSKDGLFRIYTWDSQLGGTMRFFNVFYQYKSGKTIKTQSILLEEGDPAWFCSGIFTLITKKKKYYLGIINGIYSTKDVSQSIKGFELTESGTIDDNIDLFQINEGLQNSLRISYDFFSVADRPERPVRLIRYDTKNKEITIECVSDEEKILPNCYTIYQFNGTHFEETDQKMK